MEVKVKERFRHEGDEFEEGEIVDLPGDTAERAIERGFAEKAEEKEITPIEAEEGAEGTREEGETIWSEMEESLDEEPELPGRWNPPRDKVKSGEVSAGDVDDLLGAVKRLDVHRKYDTPMAVVETPEGGEATVFRQKAIEAQRAEANDISEHIILGRKPESFDGKTGEGSSYFSYGQVYYKPPPHYLKGRIHIDTKNSFIYGKCGL